MKPYYTDRELEDKLNKWYQELLESFTVFEKTGEVESVLLFDLSANYANGQDFTKEDTQNAINEFREDISWNINMRRVSIASVNLGHSVETFSDLGEGMERFKYIFKAHPHPNRTKQSITNVLLQFVMFASMGLIPKVNLENS